MKVEADASVPPGQIALRFDSRVEREFEKWIKTPDGERVFVAAYETAYRLLRRGWKHYSMDAILHVIRYSDDVACGPDHGYKINNNRGSLLARKLMATYPELEGFFEIRELRGR